MNHQPSENIIKKYIAVRVEEDIIDNDFLLRLNRGHITGPHYNKNYPNKEFDTEIDAINYAYTECDYATWSIIPIIRFIK